MLLINDYTRMTWVTFLKVKSKAIERFKTFKYLVENCIDLKIKFLGLDRGGKFTSNEFNEFCEKHRIIRNFTIGKTPQRDGVVERNKRTMW